MKVNLKKNSHISYINNGAIDFYYGLKLETKLSYDDLCDEIHRRVNESFQSYNNNIKTSFQESITEAIHQSGLENELYIKDNDKSNIKDNFFEFSDLKDEIINLEFDFTERGFIIKPITIVEDYLNKMYNESKADFDFSECVYGDFYVESQTRFVLPPIKAELKNGSSSLISAILFVFKNNNAVLRITLPIDNMDSEPLMSNDLDDYIVSVENLSGFSLELKGSTIKSIKSCYCNYILSIKKITFLVSSKQMVNIILTNHSAMFDNIKRIPDKIQEDIYKISLAPIQVRNGVSYVENAINHLDKNSLFFNGIGFVLSNMGKCISLVDNTIINFAKENFEKEILYDKITNDIRRNIEFTIIILLLKNINDSYYFYKKVLHDSNLSKVKNEYNKNKIFISLLQDDVYGSVREITPKFEETMTFFLDEKNVKDRTNALNNILEEEQANRTLQLQNVLSIVGLIFTIIFGLPAINETLTLIRNLCFFITTDIPFISIENTSFAIWLLTSIGMLIFVLSKSKVKKYNLN